MARTKTKWKAFKTARKFVRSLGLKNDAEWRLYCKGTLKKKGNKPEDIPTTPNIVYKDTGWVNLGDWLGTGNLSNRAIRENYRNFRAARKFVREMGVKNRDDWQALHRAGKVPADIPFKPERAYAGKGWVSCGDWFGTGYVSPSERSYRAFTKARTFARKLGVNSRREWEKYCREGIKGKAKKPDDIPATPAKIFRTDGWLGWPDWLGKKSSLKAKAGTTSKSKAAVAKKISTARKSSAKRASSIKRKK